MKTKYPIARTLKNLFYYYDTADLSPRPAKDYSSPLATGNVYHLPLENFAKDFAAQPSGFSTTLSQLTAKIREEEFRGVKPV